MYYIQRIHKRESVLKSIYEAYRKQRKIFNLLFDIPDTRSVMVLLMPRGVVHVYAPVSNCLT